LALAPGFACAQGLPSANQVYAGPTSGPPSAPSFRALVPADVPIGSTLDSIGSTRGSILERGASTWGIVVPGTSGLPWVSNGAGADPAYQALTGSGIASGTVANSNLASMAAGTIKGSVGGGAPSDLTGLQTESLLQFLQSGTGAVQRSVDSWLKVNSVHSSDFITAGAINTQTATTNVSISSGTSALAVSASLFASTDCQGGVGCTGTLGNKAITINGAGAAGAPLVTTITSFTSATQVGLGTNAGTGLSATSELIQWGTDNTTALQNWFNQCAGTQSSCFLDPGNYTITAQLNVTTVITLTGAGRQISTIFQGNPAVGGIGIVTNSTVSSVRLSNFGIFQLFPATSAAALIGLTGTSQQFATILENLYLSGNTSAVSAAQVQYLNIDRNIWIGQTTQGLFYNYSLSCATGIAKIENSFIAPANGAIGLNVSSEGGLTVINNDISAISGPSGTGITFNSGSACAGGDIYIDNNNLENWANGISLAKGSETSGGASHISNNDFFNNTNSIILGDSNANWQLDTSLTGNQFYCTGTCVTVTNSARNISITGNTFTGSGGTPTGLNISGNAVTGIAVGNTFASLTTNVSNSSATFYAESLVNGHVKSIGVAPTISTTNCPSAAVASGSTDQEGLATFTNTATSCTVTFAQTYTVAPRCVANVNTGNAAGTTTTTSSFNVSFAAGPAQFMWWCRGN
jgi:hypothetical protein